VELSGTQLTIRKGYAGISPYAPARTPSVRREGEQEAYTVARTVSGLTVTRVFGPASTAYGTRPTTQTCLLKRQ
jgi:hypothetical protein